MTQEEGLKQRTKAFALRVMNLIDRLPRSVHGRVVANQLMKSATSVAANYRSACRGRSRAEFAAKLGVVVEEADEALFWLELIAEGKLVRSELMPNILKEANEIVAIMVSSHRTACSGSIANRKSKIANQNRK